MKTLNTLVALALLVSAVAPVCAMEEAPKAATVTTPSIFARVFASAQTSAASVKDYYAFNPENKAQSFKRYGVTAAAVAAVIGLGYAAYNFFTSEDEEEVAPVEPQVSTVEAAPVVEAPVIVNRPAVVVKPAVKTPARRMSKCQARAARIARAKSGKTSSCSKSRKSSCKPCQA